jgi:O-antigen ligase
LPLAGRILGLLTLAAAAFLAIQLLPTAVLTRFSTLLTPEGEYRSMEEAEIAMSTGESAQGRLRVAQDALRYTLETPLLGLGPGNFINRRNDEYHKKYGHHGWLESHNAYLQVLTEMGVPGLLIFVGIFASAYRLAKRAHMRLKQARARDDVQLRHQALGLRLLILVMALFSLFNHIAYEFYLPTIFGLALALDRIALNRFPAPVARVIPVSQAAFQAPRLAPTAPAPAAPAASGKPRLNGSPRRYAPVPAERR